LVNTLLAHKMKKMRKGRDSGDAPEYADADSPVPERIRNRRNRLGMTGAELAKRIGVSPSYVSLIESGAKIPSPSVAEKIARALRDSPDLYHAWVLSSRQGGWRQALRSSHYWQAYSTDPRSLERVASGADVPDLAGLAEAREDDRLASAGLELDASVADFIDEDVTIAEAPGDFDAGRLAAMEAPVEKSAHPEARRSMSLGGALGGLFRRKPRQEDAPRGFTLLEIPVLEDGADPGDGDEVDESQIVDTLFLDSRLFGATVLSRPFAYQPADRALRRLGERIRPGDQVVLDSGVPQLRPETIVAVRFRGEVVLTRALLKKTALLLLPAPGAGDFDVIDLGSRDRLHDLVVGRVVLTVRVW
jgi:transcriptional regulator with XRE-family HTH domain